MPIWDVSAIIPALRRNVDTSPNGRACDILSAMSTIYTLEEVAGLLGLDPGDVGTMAVEGKLSGFTINDTWRIHEPALLADLERMRDARRPVHPLPLAPLDSLEETPDVMRVTPLEQAHEKHNLQERFSIRIEIENDSEYSGDFQMSLEAEGDRDLWESFEGTHCDFQDSEIYVTGQLHPGDVISLFKGTLHAKLGDRLFVTVPEQDGIDRLTERVYVLDSDAHLRLTIVEGGMFSKRNSLRFKRL